MDGSSILPANFAVGSIFGIWPGKDLIGRTGREQAAACYAVYGPRTVLVLSRPHMGEPSAQRSRDFCGSWNLGMLTLQASGDTHDP